MIARHQTSAFSNGHAAPLGGSGSFSISPYNRFRPRSQPASRRRRQLLIRLAILGTLSTALILLFFPSLRGYVLPTLSLGLLSSADEFQLETVRYYDLSHVQGSAHGWEREERVLLCSPLREAESHLPMFFSHLRNFTYPHHLIDLAFLVSDSKDRTLELLEELLDQLQADPDPDQPYGEISVIQKDFGQKVKQDVESRHGFAAQAGRRKLMAQARNWLLSATLRPYHSWVYWRDADVETAPFTILQDLMRHNKDVIVPNVWRPLPDWLGGEQPYDLNSWQESEPALALADTLDEDAVIVEGYSEYATWRPHLAYLRDPYGDPDMEMELDGVGGVSILSKAKVFRSGVHFPAFSFEKHAETEGFGKMSKRLGFSVVGLPHYTIWHLYEPSVDDIRHMEEMEQERLAREKEEKDNAERVKKIKEQFNDPKSQWELDKNKVTTLAMKEKEKEKEMEKEKEKEKESKKQKDEAEAETESAEKTGKGDLEQEEEVKSSEKAKKVEKLDDEDESEAKGKSKKTDKAAKDGAEDNVKSEKSGKATEDDKSTDSGLAQDSEQAESKKTSAADPKEDDKPSAKSKAKVAEASEKDTGSATKETKKKHKDSEDDVVEEKRSKSAKKPVEKENDEDGEETGSGGRKLKQD